MSALHRLPAMASMRRVLAIGILLMLGFAALNMSGCSRPEAGKEYHPGTSQARFTDQPRAL